MLETVIGNVKITNICKFVLRWDPNHVHGPLRGWFIRPSTAGAPGGDKSPPPLAIARAAVAHKGDPPDHERQLLRRWGGSTPQCYTFSFVLLGHWGGPGSNILEPRLIQNVYANMYIYN